MPNPTAAAIVIGDEILSGRTRDTNSHFLAGKLSECGIALREIRTVGDDREAIVSAVRQLAQSYTHVFTCGGIGPTHDDITADCVAEACDAEIGVRDDALERLDAHYRAQNIELNDARRRMARIPAGATLIDNPISAAPGFSIANVHVMAGVPSIFRAMVDNLLARLSHGAPILARSISLDRAEGEVAAQLGALAESYPSLSFGSYPFRDAGSYGTNLVVRGPDAALIDEAFAQLEALGASAPDE